MIEQHNSLAEKFIKKWFWLYIFSFIIAPMWYIIKIIISHDLRVDEIWIIYWVMSLMVLLSAFNNFGMTESMNKFIPEYITKKRYDKVKTILFYAFLTQTITWILIFLIFYFWADYLSINYFKDKESVNIIKIFAFFFLWYNFFQVINTFFLAIQDTFIQKITEFLRMSFVVIFVIYIFLSDLWNMFNYSLSWVLWLYFWIIFSLSIFYKKYYIWYLKKEKILFDKKLFTEILKYALLVFLWAQVATLLSQVDMQMIIYLLSNTDAWYYTNYLSIIWIPFMIIWPIFAFFFPVFSEMNAKKEFDKIRLVKSIFQKNFLIFGLAFVILFFVFWENIAVILFWEKFRESWIILKYSILFLIFNFLLQINFNIFAAIWKVKQRLYIILIALIFNIILNIILINLIWVYGAALATWCGWFLIWIMSEKTLKDFRVWFDIKFLIKNIVFLFLLWIFMFYFIVPVFDWLSRIVSFFVLSGIWIVYFWLFLIFNKSEFRYFFQEIKRIKSWK